MKEYPILIVDEDPNILSTLSSILEGKGYDVTTADSMNAAIEIIKKQSFDLIITDLEGNQTNGIDVLGTAKRLKPDMMVIILTSHSDADSVSNALRHGADDFMLKPVGFSELYFRVSLCMKKLEFQKADKCRKILSMCCVCKKVHHGSGKKRGKEGWIPLEQYIREKTKLDITSAYCPECLKARLAELGKMYNIKPAFAVFGTASTSRNEDH